MASAPTSGSASGIYLYEATTSAELVKLATDVINNITGRNGAAPIIATIESMQIVNAVASDTTASFGNGTVTVGGTSYDDADVVASSAGAFEFQSGGSNYILSNGALGQTVDTLINALIAQAGPTTKVGEELATAKVLVDDFGLGGVTVIASSSFSTGTSYVPPCFVRGTMISTARGEVAVEDLREGDLVTLAAGGTAPVIWIGRRRVDLRLQGLLPTMLPVLVRAGALGGGLPTRDLRVSPDHALFLDGVLVPAGLLIDGRNIVAVATDVVEYFHVELPQHAVLLAEGAAAESYLDTGNRGTFSNAAIVSMTPDFSVDADAVEAAGPCAEMVLGGPVLERIRATLAAVELPGAEGLRQVG